MKKNKKIIFWLFSFLSKNKILKVNKKEFKKKLKNFLLKNLPFKDKTPQKIFEVLV